MAIIFNPTIYKLGVYNKPLVAKPVDLCAKGLTQKSKVVPVVFNWTTDFPTFAFILNLNQGTAGQTIPAMLGCYIDNSANLTELILICDDTGYSVTINQGEQRYIPLITQIGSVIRVYNGQQSNTLVGFAPTITMLFTDFFIPEFAAAAFPRVITQDQISSTIVSGNVQQNFASGVLGDTYVSNDYSLTASGNIGTLLPTNAFGGSYVITNMIVATKGLYTPNNAAIFLNTQIRYGAGPASQFTIGNIIFQDDNSLFYKILYQQSGLFLILDASQTINVFNANAIAGGLITYTFDYAWVILIN